MILVEQVFASLENWGQHPVMTEISPGKPDISMNSDSFVQKVESLSRIFAQMGIGERTPVPMFLENSIDFPISFLALIRLNAIPVMVKLEYRSIELTEVFRNLDPDVVISEISHIPVIEPWLTGKTVIVRNKDGFSRSQIGPDRCRSIDVPDDVATINYTYRGYGYPLGSMASHSQYLHGAEVLQAGLQALPGESMLVILPMSHIFTLIGCVMVPFMSGLTAVISRTMNPRHLFSTISKYSIQHLLSIPEIYELLSRVHRGDEALESLKVFVSGGSYLAPERFREYSEKFGVEVLHGYGLTEFTPVSRNIRSESKAGTIGPICDGISCQFDDGEILLDSAHVTRGYYGRGRETAEAFKDGLFRTGDMGHMEKDHLVFDKEKKQTRKINGNIVDLTEVENVINAYPGTDRCRLEYNPGRFSAYVVLKNNSDSTLDDLRDYLVNSIARFKVPQLILGELE
jgi:long-subunit acyl-CoA synthetase (AMP-forming)